MWTLPLDLIRLIIQILRNKPFMDHSQLIFIASMSLIAIAKVHHIGPLQLLIRVLVYMRAGGYAVRDTARHMGDRVKQRWPEYLERARREQ